MGHVRLMSGQAESLSFKEIPQFNSTYNLVVICSYRDTEANRYMDD